MTAPDSPEHTIAALRAELAAAQAEMQDFSYTVSHDLRASLRHILSYAALVEEDAGPQLSDEVRGFLQTITESARHMGAQMDALLDLSRVGTAALQMQCVALSTLVDDVRDELAQAVGTRSVQWVVDPNLPQVWADAALLHQVVLQVLGNAVKFTAQRAHAHIHIAAHLDEALGQVQLSVRDSGAGFNPAMQSKLFHAFQRLHATKQFPGMGMGLAVARKAVRRMGGDMEAQGAVDAGCTMTIRLRLPPA